ncbi:MAG: DedA family protein [Deltaproteobacteria bacterium]|nr:DedA family protein [Deltaproteobacteria bacterium]
MASYIDAFLTYIARLPDALIYIFLGLSAFVENVFPPIPGDTITAFGAFLVGTGRLSFTGVYVSTCLGSLMGFMLLFRVGGLLGRRFLVERDYRFFKAADIVRAELWFQKYGYYLILLNRFLPGVRSAVSIVGGISRLKPLKVGIFALISICVWNVLWIGLGYALGNNWETVKARMAGLLAGYNLAVVMVFAVVILIFLIRKRLKRPKGEKQ